MGAARVSRLFPGGPGVGRRKLYVDEKQWGKRRRDREQGIERKRIRETVGGEGGREKERGEEKEPDTRTHTCAHTGTHTHT